MDADREMQEYSERQMSRTGRIITRIFAWAFRLFVFGIIAMVLWRVLFSGMIPRGAKTLLVNEATCAAYVAEGEELTMYTQSHDKLAIDERDEGALGLFWVCESTFIPKANQIQILTRYNNSTLRHIVTDFKLDEDEIPTRDDIVADVTLVVTTDPTPDAPRSGDEYETRYHASGEPTKARASMYNYRKYIFDGIEIDPETTTDITAEFYYVGRVNYDIVPYSFLRIYDRETENDPVRLTARDERAIRAYASGQ